MATVTQLMSLFQLSKKAKYFLSLHCQITGISKAITTVHSQKGNYSFMPNAKINHCKMQEVTFFVNTFFATANISTKNITLIPDPHETVILSPQFLYVRCNSRQAIDSIDNSVSLNSIRTELENQWN